MHVAGQFYACAALYFVLSKFLVLALPSVLNVAVGFFQSTDILDFILKLAVSNKQRFRWLKTLRCLPLYDLIVT